MAPPHLWGGGKGVLFLVMFRGSVVRVTRIQDFHCAGAMGSLGKYFHFCRLWRMRTLPFDSSRRVLQLKRPSLSHACAPSVIPKKSGTYWFTVLNCCNTITGCGPPCA